MGLVVIKMKWDFSKSHLFLVVAVLFKIGGEIEPVTFYSIGNVVNDSVLFFAVSKEVMERSIPLRSLYLAKGN